MSMNLRDALERVAELRVRILESQKFRGYSGRARAIGGCVALIGALALNLAPQGVRHFAMPAVWGCVFVIAFSLNYGAVIRWWWNLSGEERRRSPLGPALECLPVFLVGGLITGRLMAEGNIALLPGVWSSVFALTHFTAKYAMPRGMRAVGWWYLAAGAAMLAFPEAVFRDPVIPGAVFFLGEIAGGALIFRAYHRGGIPAFLIGRSAKESSSAGTAS